MIRERRHIRRLPVLLVAVAWASPVLAAEFTCAPAGSPARFSVEDDAFFAEALAAWRPVTAGRPTEGNQENCQDVKVVDYETYPTKRCTYSDADAGRQRFPSLQASVILLNPSATQLARWTVHACRVNGATDKVMRSCLAQVTNVVRSSNSAQFPVVGSVVESTCNSGGKVRCEKLPVDAADRAPRNTLFRDGVNVYYGTLARWSKVPLSSETYSAIFDTLRSDKDITSWRQVARLAGAYRDDWKAWRKHKSRPIAPDGVPPADFDLENAGWGIVAREVHKRACASDSNELIDAVVFKRKLAR